MTSSYGRITVTSVQGREVLDSRGNPTVEAEVRLSNGVAAHALVPSGASTGSHEAVELRDEDPASFGGRGVRRAVANVNDVIGPWLAGRSPLEQASIDEGMCVLDGTPNKGRLGANAILAVSLAVSHAAAASEGVSLWRYLAADGRVSLPVPMFNILNGGRHASNSADIQEFMVLPVGVDTFSDALRAGAEIYQSLRSLLRADGHNLNVGDEGGFAPSLPSNRDALEMVLRAVEAAGYAPGREVYLGLDVAATEFYDEASGKYVLDREGATLDSGELIDLYEDWAGQYPIISIEDGLSEDDWAGWSAMRDRLGATVQLVGDDLLVTNISRIGRSIRELASNAVLLKPNQIGTLTETRAALDTARTAGWGAVMSHRSGETEDTTIADLSVGWDVRQIKTGAPARSERVAKYNRLLRIEAELGNAAAYAGKSAFEYLGRTL
ncbi:Enolase [Geodia barretti]|uniref:Enolase n=1 Tax=Geodia barretti TaxID=519541 RepID=A0AA35RD31_GEOBA|nr:Enolase [Geodia barretti]